MNKVVSNSVWGQMLVDLLVAMGAGRFFISPGARSSAIVAALSQKNRADLTVHYDERGMSFAALGWAMATGKPAVCVTTSGSAVANLLPACVEASYSGVPLIFLTSDRPAELRESGANQAIHQPGIFGTFVRSAIDFPCPEDAGNVEELIMGLRSTIELAVGANPGPVHLNVPFREPLLPADTLTLGEEFPISLTESKTSDYPSRTPDSFFDTRKGAILIGRLPVQEQKDMIAVLELGSRLGWPVFADALSGARLLEGVIGHADWILHRNDVSRPERVLHFGGALVSKRLGMWASNCKGSDYIQVRRSPLPLDPWNQAPTIITTGIREFIEEIPRAVFKADSSFEADWQKANQAVAEILTAHSGISRELSEPSIARIAGEFSASTGIPVFLGNSMPVRDFDSCAPSLSQKPVPVYGNRGASGIDGNVSTLAGVAMATQAPVLAVMGDLTLLHDLNSLPLLRNLPLKLIIVNNDGGGIFQFLPLAIDAASLEELWETPHGLDFRAAAEQFAIDYKKISTSIELREALDLQSHGPVILECQTNRHDNYALHLQIADEVRSLSLAWQA
jgi:2-succinyl-5-enolpyruvyl-6-hydroxy-3-cyclohexene-1-carboxylate synthase